MRSVFWIRMSVGILGMLGASFFRFSRPIFALLTVLGEQSCILRLEAVACCYSLLPYLGGRPDGGIKWWKLRTLRDPFPFSFGSPMHFQMTLLLGFAGRNQVKTFADLFRVMCCMRGGGVGPLVRRGNISLSLCLTMPCEHVDPMDTAPVHCS